MRDVGRKLAGIWGGAALGYLLAVALGIGPDKQGNYVIGMLLASATIVVAEVIVFVSRRQRRESDTGNE